jgi:hypothetical protein
MRARDTIICSVCVVLFLGLLVAAGMQLDYINSQRTEMKLIINEPLKNAPPSLAFATVALGGFRGLIVDILWIEGDRLKEEGQFFDLRQRAEWITTLQPRFPAVWEYHAWNMAYNISVAIPATEQEDRWRWVRNGYELLRDKGIPLNPKSIQLYKELGRIFQHKIGGVSDDAHKYYKLQLAQTLQPLLEPANDEYFDALAESPLTKEKLEADANVAALTKALAAADSTFANTGEFVANYLSLRQNATRFDPAAAKVIDDHRGTKALMKLDVFAKAYQLRNTWKLEPVLMRRLNKTYGPIDWNDPNRHLPLDWRHPDTHAIYWAVRGLEALATDQQRHIEITEMNTDRMVAHGLQNLFRSGQIFLYETSVQEPLEEDFTKTRTRTYREVFYRPDLRMFEPYNNSVLAIIQKYAEDKENAPETLQNGHRNMLKNAVLSFYQSGHKRQARIIFRQLKELYPLPEFDVSVDEYAKARFYEELENLTINDAKEMMIAILSEGYFLFAIRDDEGAYVREQIAQQVYDHYQSMYDDSERINLPDIRLLKYLGLVGFLTDQQFAPEVRQRLLGRIEVERPDLYKQLQEVEEQIRQQSEQEGMTP